MEWLGLTFGYSLLSALIPVFNAELYLIGLAAKQPQLPWWLLGITAATGQMVGKLVFYYAGRGSIALPARLRRKSDKERTGRFARWFARFRDTARERPAWAFAVLLVSAAVGLPPYAASAVLAGVARVNLSVFLVSGLLGRAVRFGAIAASPGLLDSWFF